MSQPVVSACLSVEIFVVIIGEYLHIQYKHTVSAYIELCKEVGGWGSATTSKRFCCVKWARYSPIILCENILHDNFQYIFSLIALIYIILYWNPNSY